MNFLTQTKEDEVTREEKLKLILAQGKPEVPPDAFPERKKTTKSWREQESILSLGINAVDNTEIPTIEYFW